jgi:hypothetical protein
MLPLLVKRRGNGRVRALLFVAALVFVGTSAAAADFSRQTLTMGVGKNMETTLYVPRGAGPYPTVLVMHTSGGISEADRGYCANLAREGYICAAPAFLRGARYQQCRGSPKSLHFRATGHPGGLPRYLS